MIYDEHYDLRVLMHVKFNFKQILWHTCSAKMLGNMFFLPSNTNLIC